jgi:peptidoglycan/xylan/chitin deacetylase (PgdA/CDA1 family)
MARRHPAVLMMAVLLLLGACAADSSASAWHTPAPIASGGGAGAGAPASPSPSPSPSSSPTAAAPRSASPTVSLARPKPSATTRPPAPPFTPGHGPFGSMSSTGSSAVALTFDDGPGGNTGQVLDLLKRYGIHATFCVIGEQVSAQASMIRRIVNEGHTLCNHTWTHDEKLRTRSTAQIVSELQRTNDAIHAIAPNARIAYFRNPGGNFSPQTMSIAAGMGMKSLFWNVDPRDWADPGTSAIINNVMNHTHSGSIVLMHDGGGNRSQTVSALRSVLPSLKRKYALVPLPVPAT